MSQPPLDDDFIALLSCPVTRQALRVALPEELIGRRDNAGQPLNAALRRSDGAVLYPIRNGIPVLLAEEAVRVEPMLGTGA
ncbi:MAG TPA: hypothetical protein VF614_17050 [Chthoniobacteraceae bacterium]|jgi:uncharacterized protein YbaR (Trm112 family)